MITHAHRYGGRGALALGLTAALILFGVGSAPQSVHATAVPTVAIAQYPLTVAVPAHPQVLFAIGNSESMDGDLSGAIMTGSGALTVSGTSYLQQDNNASPVNYSVPAGFTPPINPGSAGSAPYTVTTAGVEYDNSASRLNVAKQGITAILNAYMQYADFALEDYSTTYNNCCGTNPYTTWVYYMSNAGGFTFLTAPPSTGEYVTNPCWNVPLTATPPATLTTVSNNCKALDTYYGGIGINNYEYMPISTSSDDPDINDVLYATGFTPIWVNYNGPSHPNPYMYFTLANYNAGNVVTECYNSATAGGAGLCETPTNAGYVPYSTEVMQVERGFGFIGSQSASTATTLVGLKSSGAIPTPSSVAAAIAPFTPYLQPETNSVTTTEIKAMAVQSPIAALLKSALTYYNGVPDTGAHTSNGCKAARYVVLVTDGLPTEDLSGHLWPPLGSVSGTGYGVTASFKGDGSFLSTNDQALQDTITEIQDLQSAGVQTYVIGLGAGVEPAVNSMAASTLTAMAIAGGTGSYFAATSPTDLTNDMQAILAQILKETAATSASAINSTGISTTSVAYQGTFTTSDIYEDWTGNLLAYPINPSNGYINTAYSAATWQAQVQLDAQNWTSPGRLIVTWDPVTSEGIPFQWDPSTTATSGIASSTALGAALTTYTGDTNGADVLHYLRGDSSLEQRHTGGTFRNRSHKLGDIVDSSPVYVGAPSGPWQQASYYTFENKYRTREPMLYIGANDGMLHAFDAATGNEVFAYVPNGVWSNLIKLVNPYYNAQHQFFVDGTPQAADVQFASDGSWHTMLFGSERAGGNTIFAIDVTDPTQFTSEAAVAEDVKWEFNVNNSDGNMGNTFSEPVAVYTAAGFAVMFGNGYNSPTNTPYLYALNPETGAVMAKINLCGAVPSACNLSQPNGLSSITAMNTTGALLSGNPNVVYAGDLQGNLWRVDISNTNPADWTVSVLFKATDSLGNAQPITVTPAASLNPLAPALAGAMVYFATGQLLGLPDLGNTQVQSVYGIFDSGTAPATPYMRSCNCLAQQTITTQASATNYSGGSSTIRILSSNPVNLPSEKGWYVDLYVTDPTTGAQTDPGERVVTDPTMFDGTLQLTTYQPNPNTCDGGGNAYYMVFNYATGGATTLPQFDWYGNGSITNNDLYMGQTVGGVSLGNSYAAAPKMVTMGDQAVVYTTTGAAQVGGLCNGQTCDPGTLNSDQLARGAWQELK